METRLKILISLLIPYAFFCAGLHHIAYWKSFNINGLEYLDVTEIITTFIQPFLYYSIGAILIQLLIYIVSSIHKFTKPVTTIDENNIVDSPSLSWINFKLKTIRMIGYSYIAVALLITFQKDWYFKDVILSLVYLPAEIYVVTMTLISLQIKNINKNIASLVVYICLLPTLSYDTGRFKAILVEYNLKYSYSVNAIPGDTLKYLGKASDNYIFVDFKNTRHHILKSSSINNLELIHVDKYNKP
jgi:hypothetical protein